VNEVSRRSFLGALGFGALALAAPARALERIPYGGTLRLSLPWTMAELDPHDPASAMTALFGDCVFEPLFALDSRGQPYPTLAAELPQVSAKRLRVTLRPGLLTAANRALDAKDALFSLNRAREHRALAAARNWRLSLVNDTPLAFEVEGSDALALARALAVPAASMVPRRFDPRMPDGTGPFALTKLGSNARLSRNPRAARGPAWLDAIELNAAPTLGDSLRAFEVGESEVGWGGAGLYRSRPGAVTFDAGLLGWVVLRTGTLLGPWGAPGIAQHLIDGIDGRRLEHLGLRDLPRGAGDRWDGAACELMVDASAGQMLQIAEALIGLWAEGTGRITLRPTTARELSRARSAGDFALMLDFLRPLDGTASAGLALRTADGVERLPTVARDDWRDYVRAARVGVLGSLRISGALAPGFAQLASWRLADTYLLP